MWYKIKRILVWTQQVRPAHIYEYSYDFRGKSKSQLQTDWWTLTSTWNTYFDSTYWIYCTSNTNNVTRSLWTVFSNAKKIVFWLKWYYSWVSSWNAIWLSWRTYTNSTSTNRCGIWIDKPYDSSAYFYYNLSGTLFAWPTIWTWWLEYSCEFDLVNKTVSYNVNWTTWTWTMSDSDVTNIKTNNYIYFYYWQTGWSVGIYWTSVSLYVS
jgi:hypothetical protein